MAIQNSQLVQDVAEAKGYMSSGINAAQSGVNAVLGGKGTVDNAVKDIQSITGEIKNIGSSMLQTTDEVKQQYQSLLPYADILGGYGDSLWSEGEELSLQAKELLGQGNDLISLNPDAGGLAGEFIKYWNSLSPDMYVSRAASDTTSAFTNAKNQAMRDLARRGVSLTSGNALELQRKYLMDYAKQLAANKTKAMQQGLDAQSAQLDKMVSASSSLYGMGSQMEQNSLSAKSNAVNAQLGSANVKSSVASGLSNVVGLESSAASVFGNVANLYEKAASLETNYLNLVQSAYGNLQSAYSSAAGNTTSLIGTLSKVWGHNGGVNVIDNTKAAQEARVAAGKNPIATFEKPNG